MSMMDRVARNTTVKPAMMLVYGVAGIGKTSLGASTPNPIFLQTEDGLGTLDVNTFGLLKTFDEIMAAVVALYEEPHDFQTVVLDSVDHLETIVWAQTCKDNGWKSMEEVSYGKSYLAALDNWRLILDGLRALRDDRGMTVLLVAHSTIIKFSAPDSESYDRYSPKMHKAASALVMETMDAVLFCNYRVSTVSTDVGFNKKIIRGVGGGDRIIYTEERPAFVAKQRYDMPASIPMTWIAIAEHIPAPKALQPRQPAPSATSATSANAA